MILRKSLFSLAVIFLSTGTLRADEIRHSFFVAGPTFTGVIEEDGSTGWDSGQPGARDGFVLPNGNFLIAWAKEVKELTSDQTVVFHYRLSDANQEIGTAVRLANGNTMITELGARPRLMEVTTDGSVAIEVPLQPETDNAHMQTRMARKLANGNYLVPHLLAFKVKEYTPEGKIVRTIATDLEELGGRAAENWPFTAILLDNNQVLVNLTHGNKTVIFNHDGTVAWKIGNEDFDRMPFDDPCGAQRLPNGNIVICSYHAQKGIKVFEVTPEKKIVWTYEGPHRAHEIQVLTTNGKRLPAPPQK
ncbi:MAG: hypothetical protein R3C20_14675 [Planctomycetaceae bacterium]